MKKWLALLLLTSLALAMSNGAPTLDCTMCHVGAANHPAKFIIKGLPKRYEPCHTYNITIKIVKGPPCDPTVGCGGFAVHVSAGKLIVTDKKDTMLAYNPVDGYYITHTLQGHLKREWSFEWKAPCKPVPVKFKVSVIAANGDATFNGDWYAGATYTIYPVGWGNQTSANQAQTGGATGISKDVYYLLLASVVLNAATLGMLIVTYVTLLRRTRT